MKPDVLHWAIVISAAMLAVVAIFTHGWRAASPLASISGRIRVGLLNIEECDPNGCHSLTNSRFPSYSTDHFRYFHVNNRDTVLVDALHRIRIGSVITFLLLLFGIFISIIHFSIAVIQVSHPRLQTVLSFLPCVFFTLALVAYTTIAGHVWARLFPLVGWYSYSFWCVVAAVAVSAMAPLASKYSYYVYDAVPSRINNGIRGITNHVKREIEVVKTYGAVAAVFGNRSGPSSPTAAAAPLASQTFPDDEVL